MADDPGYTTWAFARTQLTLEECAALDAIEAEARSEAPPSDLIQRPHACQSDVTVKSLQDKTDELLRGAIIPSHLRPRWKRNGNGAATLYV